MIFILLYAFTILPIGDIFAQEKYKVTDIPEDVKIKMIGSTWKPGCPVPLKDLSYLTVPYYGFDNKNHLGFLIVHKNVAHQVGKIFYQLFQQKFPIEKMQLMDTFHGDDDLAMSANNTSAFNCRSIIGKPGIFSLHSYGIAIDINTKLNPYVKGNLVLPKEGKAYVDRSQKMPGKIIFGDSTYMFFRNAGWSWGGDWTTLKDYQHFEKSLRSANISSKK